LFVPCCPTTIAGLIITIIVDTFYAMLWRRLTTHVGEKVLVAVVPAMTNFDATAAVM
jgi:hypothetical protein